MTQLYPILLVAVLFAADAGLSRGPVAGGTAVALGVPAAVVAIAALGFARARRRLARGAGGAAILASERLLTVARWTLLAGHAVAVLLFGWLDAVRTVLGDLVIVDEVVALLPPLAGLAALWALHYPIERRLREALLLRRLDEGRAVHPIPGRGRWVLQRARIELGLMLVPVLMIVGLGESIRLVAVRIGPDLPPWTIDLATLAGGLAIFGFAPLLARLVLSVRPLGPGPVRDDLEAICARHRVRVGAFLVWRTDGTMINAAVMGLLPSLRVVLLTDALLESLDRDQVRAVMAHEIAHLRHRHLPWMLAALLACLLAAGWIVGAPIMLASVAFDLVGPPPAWSEAAATALAAVLALIAFGWISRRFERQADAFAAAHLSLDSPGEPSPEPESRVRLEGVAAMTGALDAISRLNGVDPRRPSWRHGSIAWRRGFLEQLVGAPTAAMPCDHVARRIKVAVLLLLLAGGGATWWLDRSLDPPPATPELNER